MYSRDFLASVTQVRQYKLDLIRFGVDLLVAWLLSWLVGFEGHKVAWVGYQDESGKSWWKVIMIKTHR